MEHYQGLGLITALTPRAVLVPDQEKRLHQLMLCSLQCNAPFLGKACSKHWEQCGTYTPANQVVGGEMERPNTHYVGNPLLTLSITATMVRAVLAVLRLLVCSGGSTHLGKNPIPIHSVHTGGPGGLLAHQEGLQGIPWPPVSPRPTCSH